MDFAHLFHSPRAHSRQVAGLARNRADLIAEARRLSATRPACAHMSLGHSVMTRLKFGVGDGVNEAVERAVCGAHFCRKNSRTRRTATRFAT